MQPCLEGGFSVVRSRLALFKLLTRPHLLPCSVDGVGGLRRERRGGLNDINFEALNNTFQN